MMATVQSCSAARSCLTRPAAATRLTIHTLLLFVSLSVTHFFLNAVTADAQAVLQLDGRDSIIIIQEGPLYFRGQRIGLRVDYVAIDSLSDTVALRSRALSIFARLRPALDSSGTVTLVVHATQFLPTPSTSPGVRSFRGYGYVIKRASDGKWYFKGSSSPIPDSLTGAARRPTKTELHHSLE